MNALQLTSTPVTGGNTASPKSQSTSQKAARTVAALNIITGSCHSVVNTQLLPPATKPAWFDDLDAKLTVAKRDANTWINDLGPEVTSAIPGHVINYATTYAAFSKQIVNILTQYPDAKGKEDPHVRQVFELIGGLRSQVQDILDAVERTSAKLTEWGQSIQSAHNDLTTGAANIQAAEHNLQQDIDQMNTAIQALQHNIDVENKYIAYSAGAIGVGLFVGVVGLALAPVTGGLSLIVAGLGAGVAVGGGAAWTVLQTKINSQLGTLADDQKKIDADKRQIIALKGLSLSTGNAISSLNVADTTLSDFRNMWLVFDKELKSTMNDLDDAKDTLSAITNLAWISAAQNEWDEALKFAENLSGTAPTIEHRVLQIGA